MKKVLLILMLLSLNFAAAGAGSDVQLNNFVRVCDSWRYNSDVRGYVCSFTSSKELVDRYDLMQLHQKIEDLEKRVRALEAER